MKFKGTPIDLSQCENDPALKAMNVEFNDKLSRVATFSDFRELLSMNGGPMCAACGTDEMRFEHRRTSDKHIFLLVCPNCGEQFIRTVGNEANRRDRERKRRAFLTA